MDLVVTLRHKPVLTLLLLRSSFARTVSVGRASASKGAISTLGCWRHVDDPEHSQDMARELQLSWKVFESRGDTRPPPCVPSTYLVRTDPILYCI